MPTAIKIDDTTIEVTKSVSVQINIDHLNSDMKYLQQQLDSENYRHSQELDRLNSLIAKAQEEIDSYNLLAVDAKPSTIQPVEDLIP